MSIRTWLLRLLAGACLSAGVVCVAAAHHSYAAYDMTKTLKAKATIKEFYWGAPHSSAAFVLKDGPDRGKVLTLQGAAPTTMTRANFSPRDMRKGTDVTITWHPMRNGEPGGALSTIMFPDGRVFGDNEFGNVSPQSSDESNAPPAAR